MVDKIGLVNCEPFFSIIIPAFNAERFIEECLCSVVVQDFNDYEVIIVDDGSTDATQTISASFLSRFSSASLINKNNEGVYRARIDALKAAKGRYVIFLDADDLLSPDALQIIWSVLSLNHFPDLLLFGSSSCYSDVCEASHLSYDSQIKCTPVNLDKYKSDVLSARNNTLWGKAIRRELLPTNVTKYSSLHITHGEDLVQLLICTDLCDSVFEIPNQLYYYRISSSSTTAHYDASKLSSLDAVFDALFDFGSRWGLYYYALIGAVLHLCSTFRIYWFSRSNSLELEFDRFVSLIRRNEGLCKVTISDVGLNNYLLIRLIRSNSRLLVSILLKAEAMLKRIF